MSTSMENRPNKHANSRTAWALDDARKRCILGFSGFVAEAVALILAWALASLNKGFSSIELPIIWSAASFLIVPIGIWFWYVWYRAARDTRQSLSEHLNVTADADDFHVPVIPAISDRYAPWVALVIVCQILFLLLLFNLPIWR